MNPRTEVARGEQECVGESSERERGKMYTEKALCYREWERERTLSSLLGCLCIQWLFTMTLILASMNPYKWAGERKWTKVCVREREGKQDRKGRERVREGVRAEESDRFRGFCFLSKRSVSLFLLLRHFPLFFVCLVIRQYKEEKDPFGVSVVFFVTSFFLSFSVCVYNMRLFVWYVSFVGLCVFYNVHTSVKPMFLSQNTYSFMGEREKEKRKNEKGGRESRFFRSFHLNLDAFLLCVSLRGDSLAICSFPFS